MNELMTKVTNAAGGLGLRAQKYAPEALLTVGIGGIIFSTVQFCKKTPKAEEVIKDFVEAKKQIKDVKENPEYEEAREKTGYSALAYRKELFEIYGKTLVKLGRVYALPLATGAFSLACILGSHGLMRKRIAGLTAAYTAVDTAFRRYRERVVERFGEEVDKDLKLGRKTEEIITGIKETKDGGEKPIKEKVTTLEGTDDPSEYGRWFADGMATQYKHNDPTYNFAYLKGQETYFNNLLESRGHVFLNEVYDALGIERTPAGSVVGWLKGGKGDGFIDFNIVDNAYRSSNLFNVNPDSSLDVLKQDSYFLDFNVDGVIWDKI